MTRAKGAIPAPKSVSWTISNKAIKDASVKMMLGSVLTKFDMHLYESGCYSW